MYVEEIIFSSERPKIYCSRYLSVVAVGAFVIQRLQTSLGLPYLNPLYEN